MGRLAGRAVQELVEMGTERDAKLPEGARAAEHSRPRGVAVDAGEIEAGLVEQQR
jgi:hypothetical protein